MVVNTCARLSVKRGGGVRASRTTCSCSHQTERRTPGTSCRPLQPVPWLASNQAVGCARCWLLLLRVLFACGCGLCSASWLANQQIMNGGGTEDQPVWLCFWREKIEKC